MTNRASFLAGLAMITSIAAMLMFIGHLGLTGNAGAAPKATPLIAISSGQIVNLSVSTAWQESDTSIGNFGQTPVSLGMVDFATGKVTDGDYLLYVEIDLGSAPLQSANLQVRDQSGDVITVQITQGSPNFVGVFPVSNSAFTIDPEGATVGAFKIRAFRDPAAPIGAEGMLSIKTALVDSITPNLAQAPGVSQTVRYFVTATNPIQHLAFDFVERGGAK